MHKSVLNYAKVVNPGFHNNCKDNNYHNKHCKTMDEMKLTKSNLAETENKISEPVTPKSQKQTASSIKRWASVVKAQKDVQKTKSDIHVKQLAGEDVQITSEINDCSFETHKVFIDENEHSFSCSVCSLELGSVSNLSNHLKTRNHEDNVISFFKAKLPVSLHSIIEFISFCGSNLCCNLCQFKIDMSSNNPYQTIVSIIAHNASLTHVSRKANHGTHNEAYSLLATLATVNPEIKMNAHYIDTKMNPQFNCNLCSKNILYDENIESLTDNFISHLRSIEHIKYKRAVETLELFGESGVCEKGYFTVSNGNILCIYCNQQLETDLKQLISHVDGVEHAKNMFSELRLTSSQESKTFQESKKKIPELLENFNPKKYEINQKEKFQQSNTKKHYLESRSCDLQSLPSEINCTGYIIENDKGSLVCLICNCLVPSSAYNLQTHIMGANHKKNEKLMKTSKTEKIGINNLSHAILTKHHEAELIPQKKTSPAVTTLPIPNLHCPEDKISTLLGKIPNSLLACRCQQMKNFPSSTVNHLYNLIFMRNSLLSENKNIFIKNVDGKHGYCNLCKVLIPLSLDIDILEGNIVLHLNGERHKINLSSQHSMKMHIRSKHESSKAVNTVRSLFLYPDVNKNPVAKPVCKKNFLTKLGINQHDFTVLKSAVKNIVDKEVVDDLQTITEKSFADEEKNSDHVKFESFNKVSDELSIAENHIKFPVTQTSDLLKFKTETNEDVLNRRQKQIDYGKNTEGYTQFCQMVPKRLRSSHYPMTPPKHLKCSRRAWDGMIRAWRRQLHNWDPSADIAIKLDSDVEP